MIIITVMDYLAEQTGLPAFGETPADPPDEFLVIEKTGSGLVDHISRATIAIQSNARKLLRAAEINELVKSAMASIVELSSISAARLSSDYNFTDTAEKRYRYQAVYDVFY